MPTPYNRTSVAYDLSLFDTAQRKERKTEQPVEQPKPELKIAQASAAKVGRPLAVILIAGLFLAVFTMFLYSKAQLSEINLKIAEETNAYESAQMLNGQLQNELNGSVSIDNVEDYALNKMGMQKVNASQERYIEMSTGALTETAKAEDENIFVSIFNWFGDVLEYLGF
ncbi:MAG: hypothetical protein J1E39_04890 [Eubacterium sp.]|nr:hypothetical protein [Eubacterium sp.]